MTADTKIKLDTMLTVTGFAMALLVQTATIVWWASGVSNQVASIVETNIDQTDRIKRVEQDSKQMAVGAATVAAQLQAVRDSIDDVRDGQNEILRRLTQTQDSPK